ncbi:DUF3237 domain-containing protein [Deferrisoma palaeochoriense]
MTVPKVPIEPGLRLLYASAVSIGPPLELGATPVGVRRIIPITGGRFEGPRLRGTVLPGGADWQIIRADGVAEVSARYTLQTDDGALVQVDNWGLRHGTPEVIERLAAGEPVDPGAYYFRTAPRFQTGHPAYEWLNRTVCIAVGERRAREVLITVYEVL